MTFLEREDAIDVALSFAEAIALGSAIMRARPQGVAEARMPDGRVLRVTVAPTATPAVPPQAHKAVSP